MTSDDEKILEHVDRAIHGLLAARVELVDATRLAKRIKALDTAIVIDVDYQKLRSAFHKTLHALPDGDAKFEVEAAVNALVVQALDVGWRVGFMAHVGKENDA